MEERVSKKRTTKLGELPNTVARLRVTAIVNCRVVDIIQFEDTTPNHY